MAKNKGEIEEMRLKLALVYLRDNLEDFELDFISTIKSVGFDGEYAKNNFNTLDDIKQLSATDVENACIKIGAFKSPSKAKSDVFVNNTGLSLKYSASAPSAIVNHTHRAGFEFACKQVNSDISKLDKMIEEYWILRKNGDIKQDIQFTDSLCPFNDKKYLLPILKYFLFIGTGSCISEYPSKYFLEFSDSTDKSTWKISLPETIVEEIWDRLVFSVRSKAMPENFETKFAKKYPEKYASIAKWTSFWQNKHRGTLHIRIK